MHRSVNSGLTRRHALVGTGALVLSSQVPNALAMGQPVALLEPWQYAAEIVKRIQPPKFPDREFNIRDYGADGTEVDDSSDAIRNAIVACNAGGGGRVVVPVGDWLTGPVHLLSNVNLHIADGATLRFKTNPAAYLPAVLTRWEGVELYNYSPFIYALDQENIAVTGSGIIDGQASRENWWPWKGQWGHNQHGWKPGMPTQVPARNRLVEMAERGVPVAERIFGDGDYLRPNFIQFYRCRNVLLEGVSLRRAPMWQVHPVLCQNVTIRGLDINSHGPNNDGIDPESSKDVLIEHCRFSTGDDCIAVDSGRNADGRRINVPSEDIVIRNCQMADGHGGLTIGSIISGNARRIFAEDCKLDSPNLGTAIRFKNNAMRGGIVEDCHFRRITVGRVAEAGVTVDFNYEEGGNGPFHPELRNVTISQLQVGFCKRPVDLQGLPNGKVTALVFKDCRFDRATEQSIVKFATDVSLLQVRVNGHLIDKWTE